MKIVPFEQLLRVFWESHDPTQGMRQGGRPGTQDPVGDLRAIRFQLASARASRDAYQARLAAAGFGPITTEIAPAGAFFYAEDYHQQYLAKNPDGYCGIGGRSGVPRRRSNLTIVRSKKPEGPTDDCQKQEARRAH